MTSGDAVVREIQPGRVGVARIEIVMVMVSDGTA